MAADVIAKLRALRARTVERGCTEAEAQAAAAAAQRLVEEHRLDVASFDDDAEEVREVVKSSEPLDVMRRVVAWRGQLVHGIAVANGCDAVFRTEVGLRLVTIEIAGTRESIETARVLYHWLAYLVMAATRRECAGRGRSYTTAWRFGCATRVGQRVAAAAEATREAMRGAASGTALAIIDRCLERLAEQRAAAKALLGARGHRQLSRLDDTGFAAGYAAGERVALAHPGKVLS